MSKIKSKSKKKNEKGLYLKVGIKIFFILIMLGICVVVLFNLDDSNSNDGGKMIVLHTNMGEIKIEMATDMPITTGNFEKLVKDGFYDGVVFHRVIPNFMIQGGDPDGDGTGGPGYNIKDEFGTLKNNRGTIAMANAGPNTGGSQFFINVVNNNYLDKMHPVFGTVVEGMDVVDTISKVDSDRGDKPLKDVIIEKAEII